MKCSDLHYGQIPTSYKAVKSEALNSGVHAIFSLLKCFAYTIDSGDYMTQVFVTANYFEHISRLVYKSDGEKYKKLPTERYKYLIFTGYAETPQEVFERMQNLGAVEADAEQIFKQVWQIADLVCPMIACMDEQAFVQEYAYAIDYVIRHNCDLPKPEISSLFPKNYPDYEYWKGSIVEELNRYLNL